MMFVFMDAEKAFENTNRDFLFVLMEQLKMGPEFINAVKVIYQHQRATICLNNDLTNSF